MSDDSSFRRAAASSDISVVYTTAREPTVHSTQLWGEGKFPSSQKTYNLSPTQTVAKLCALNRFFSATELQIYHGNFLLMDNKHRKLFVVKQ